MKALPFSSLFLGFAVVFCAGMAQAQSVLPKGVGLYRFGYRSFSEQSDKFDGNGELAPLGQDFTKDFKGDNLLRGDGGSDLQRLAHELREFDGKNNQSKDSLVKALSLGSLHGDVDASVNAKILALGFGFTNRFTGYLGLPFVSARVDTHLSFAGANNAQEIKARLGDAAFDELKTGLDRASHITAADVEQGIMSQGYAPISHWQRDGIGDLQLGGLFLLAQGRTNGWGYSVLSDSSLSLPTGYVDDPDVLTDVSFGNGGFVAYTQKVSMAWIHRFFSLGGEGSATLGAPVEKKMRLPEGDETLTTADRKTTVRMTPGASFGVAGDMGLRLGAVRANYRLGFKQHLMDSYAGSLQGNYGTLAKDSDTMQTYSEISAGLDTSDLYLRKAFPVPFIMSAGYHFPHQGVNSTDERYYEVSLTSFFRVPGSERHGTETTAPRRRR